LINEIGHRHSPPSTPMGGDTRRRMRHSAVNGDSIGSGMGQPSSSTTLKCGRPVSRSPAGLHDQSRRWKPVRKVNENIKRAGSRSTISHPSSNQEGRAALCQGEDARHPHPRWVCEENDNNEVSRPSEGARSPVLPGQGAGPHHEKQDDNNW